MQFFANLRTVHKLALGFGLLLVAVVAVGYVGIRAAGRQSSELDVLYHKDMASAVDIRRAQAESIRMGRCARHALLEPDDKTIATELSHVEKSSALVGTLLARIDSRMDRPEQKAKLAEAREAIDAYTANMRALLAIAKDPAAARAFLKVGKPLVARLEDAVSAIDQMETSIAQATFDASTADSKRAALSQFVMIVFAILFGIGCSFSIGGAIARPLGRASDVLRSVAEGDFTQRLDIRTMDEIGTMAAAVDEAVASMSRAIGQVRGVASDVAVAARQLSTVSQEISSGAQQQAANLEETAASLEEITTTVHRNTENAQEAATVAASSRDVAEKGGAVVGRAIGAMTEITASSRKISDVVNTIEEFAFQTNVLALNAAVEAARAGEHGRGFAVVAVEVRELAKRSAQAAKEIKSLVNAALAKVQVGSQHVTDSSALLTEIVSSARQVTERVGQIAVASNEQLTGIEQVQGAMTQMDHVTQSNASQTEELAVTAQRLAEQADELNNLVAMFKLGDEDREQEPRSTAALAARPAAPRAPRAAGTKPRAARLAGLSPRGARANASDEF